MDGYHPGGSLVFDRLSDGSVLMAKVQRNSNNVENTRFSFVFSPDIWAGLVAYVADEIGKVGSMTTDQMDALKEREEKVRAFHKGNYQKLPSAV